MKMNNILIIVASGKSTRFGGFPKAFCKLGKEMNIENTIKRAAPYFDKIYVGVNPKTYIQFKDRIEGAELFSIITGHGDAHSLLKCMNYVSKQEEYIDYLAVCWGDAVFVDSFPFEQILFDKENANAQVACAYDRRPYAWFDSDDKNRIIKSHFAREEGFVENGIHDQSLFLFKADFVFEYLDRYRETLGIPYDADDNITGLYEMKLLRFFEYLYSVDKNIGAKCVEITSDKVLSFNTIEELENIKIFLNLCN